MNGPVRGDEPKGAYCDLVPGDDGEVGLGAPPLQVPKHTTANREEREISLFPEYFARCCLKWSVAGF